MSLSGMFRQLMTGKKKYGHSWLPKRRSRHRKSQIKAISRRRFTGRGARFGI